jgi:hypothetical protein
MKRISMIVLLIATSILTTSAQDTVPYADRPWGPGDPYVPSLGDIMGAVQLRHFKLWYASKVGNWELANFELLQINDSFLNAARLYLNIPVENINMVVGPLHALKSAIDDKDDLRFTNAFSELTAACNACHEAAHVGFIRIQTPTSSPFSNQSFDPERK